MEANLIVVFHFCSLHFVAACRAGKIEDALTFAQTQMSEAGESNPEVLSELERTLALLAFEQPQRSPFSDLLEQSHRQKVKWCWVNDCCEIKLKINLVLNRWPVNLMRLY